MQAVLRPATDVDVDFVLATFARPDNRDFVHGPTPEQYRTGLASPDRVERIIESGGEAVGLLVLAGVLSSPRIIELRVLAVTLKRQGFGEAAVRWAMRFAFAERGAHRLWLEVVAENLAACRLYEKCGFVREGVWRDGYECGDGTYKDLAAYGLLASEFVADDA